MVCLEIKGGLKKDPTLASGLYTLTSIHTYTVVKAGRQAGMHAWRQAGMYACMQEGRQANRQAVLEMAALGSQTLKLKTHICRPKH